MFFLILSTQILILTFLETVLLRIFTFFAPLFILNLLIVNFLNENACEGSVQESHDVRVLTAAQDLDLFKKTEEY